MDDIFEIIIKAFNSLWNIKKYGKTIEIITPLLTTNDCFVSIFLTERDGRYIVTDGGWISENFYNNFFDNDDEYYQRLFMFYKEQFKIKETEAKSRIYYFKSTERKELIQNIALEMSTFISTVVSSSFVQFQDNKDKDLHKRFNTNVNNYLTDITGKGKKDIKFNSAADERFKNIKFNAVIVDKSRFTLINYVTGTTDYFFKGSIGRSIMNFELINKTFLKDTIRKRITVVNDQATGYDVTKLHQYIDLAADKAESEIIMWSDKNKLCNHIG
jgi:hypothetical protein